MKLKYFVLISKIIFLFVYVTSLYCEESKDHENLIKAKNSEYSEKDKLSDLTDVVDSNSIDEERSKNSLIKKDKIKFFHNFFSFGAEADSLEVEFQISNCHLAGNYSIGRLQNESILPDLNSNYIDENCILQILGVRQHKLKNSPFEKVEFSPQRDFKLSFKDKKFLEENSIMISLYQLEKITPFFLRLTFSGLNSSTILSTVIIFEILQENDSNKHLVEDSFFTMLSFLPYEMTRNYPTVRKMLVISSIILPYSVLMVQKNQFSPFLRIFFPLLTVSVPFFLNNYFDNPLPKEFILVIVNSFVLKMFDGLNCPEKKKDEFDDKSDRSINRDRYPVQELEFKRKKNNIYPQVNTFDETHHLSCPSGRLIKNGEEYIRLGRRIADTHAQLNLLKHKNNK